MSLNVIEYRMPTTGGPGGRWRVVKHIPKDAILVNLDDDQCLDAPDVLAILTASVANGGAAAYRGTYLTGWSGVGPAGEPLACVAAGVMACYVADLRGIEETAAEIREKCGFDPFGPLGDDDAAVSLHLWRRGVPMLATGPIAIREAPGCETSSQWQKRRDQQAFDGRPLFWQRTVIAKAFGWPWIEVRT